MAIGFLGIGTMGLPMANRLLSAGVPLRIWNRTAGRCAPLVARGAIEAPSVDALFEACEVVMVMLLNQEAVDAALGRGLPAFGRRARDRTVVMLGTTSAGYSAGLAADIHRQGGRYVEAPVSGSRGPAEEGALIGMLAGDSPVVDAVEPLLRPFCRQMVRCGSVPSALRLKLAVNHYLIVLVAALAEATKAAAASGVDLGVFREVLDAGPMSSAVSRAKLHKLATGDFAPQAAIGDVAKIAQLVQRQAHDAGADASLIDATTQLFAAARARGLSGLDMVAVLEDGAMERVSPETL
ncbi:NAD(P)-dependent oxidoreductase [Thermomonas brevis]|uniref:NAD(P)-dependent oxidoreductase n=1 Tax=Thermomonas brevis TaxID=215691 RepID=A0A7G9QRT3_9GAMM|nr:NAD(P)-dependent oxidoreductase [Thermomonas brevis]QNN46058.1 NAD(P)-dependent oxidoreductase [Thermomonas brevis]